MTGIPESYEITLGNDWAGKRYADIAGNYKLHRFDKTCVDDGYLIYKHKGPSYNSDFYLLNVTDSWIVVEYSWRSDVWNGNILLKRPINDTSSFAPEDVWYFSYDSVAGKQYIEDTNIKIRYPHSPTPDKEKTDIVIFSLCGVAGVLLLLALTAFKMDWFPGAKKSISKWLRPILCF